MRAVGLLFGRRGFVGTRGVCLVLLLTLGGCSATQFVYNRLDGWLGRQIDDYVALDRQQQAQVQQALDQAWDWHRSEELPLYAQQLRSLAQASQAPLSVEQVAAFSGQMSAALDRALARIVPEGCRVLASMSDDQVTRLIENAGARLERGARKELSAPEVRQRRASERRLLRQLRRWLGSVTPEQRALVREWSLERPVITTHWYAQRRLWNRHFAALLARRQHADFCPDFERLLRQPSALWDDEIRTALAQNHQRWLGLFARLSQTLSERQRTHLRADLQELAADFDALADARVRVAGLSSRSAAR